MSMVGFAPSSVFGARVGRYRPSQCGEQLSSRPVVRVVGRRKLITAGLFDSLKGALSGDKSQGNLNKNTDYVVVGAGNAAGYIAKALKEKGLARDRLCLIGDESVAPYERPALTKAYLFPDSPARLPGFHTSVGSGGERQTDEWYAENGIELLKGQRVTSVSLENKLLTTADGSLVKYRKLFIATGSSPVKLTCEGASLGGITYVRNVADADRLVERMKTAKKMVVVGGGYIGMECAAAGVINGLETTMVFPDEYIMARLFTLEIAGHYEKLYRDRGVKFEKGELVDSFLGSEEGEVTQVKMASGKTLDADLVVVGIGASPAVSAFDTGSGVALADKSVGGITVDGRLKTNQADVWAVGDVAAFPLLRAGGQLHRFEHVDNARKMAAHAVSSMLDPAGTPAFDYLPYFYSRVFEQPGSPRPVFWQFFGVNQGDVAVFGDFAPQLFAMWVDAADGRLNGALVESVAPDQAAAVREAVLQRVAVKLDGASSVDAAIRALSMAATK